MGNDGPTVGAVIATYNSSRVVVEAIDSLLSQEPRPSQVVVVDDGSTDDTPAVLERYRSRLESIRQSNLGPSAARNTGWARLTTDAVLFLDADDVLLPGGLAARRTLLADGQAPWAYTEGLLQDSAGSRWPFSRSFSPKRGRGRGWIFQDLLCRNFITTSALIVRRELLQITGGFDVSICGVEDWDLALRLAVRYPVRYGVEPTFVQRLSPNSLSQNRCAMDRMRCLTLAKIQQLYPQEVLAAGVAARRSVADAHNWFGYGLAEAGRWGEARPILWTSVRLWPAQGRAWWLLMRCLTNAHRPGGPLGSTPRRQDSAAGAVEEGTPHRQRSPPRIRRMLRFSSHLRATASANCGFLSLNAKARRAE